MHGRDDYVAAAGAASEFCLRELWRPANRLWRSWKDGNGRLNAYLEDYAYLAEGLVELYQTTFDERWFVAARALCDSILEHFEHPDGGFSIRVMIMKY